MKQPDETTANLSPSALIDQRIRDLAGWRAEALGRMRALIHEASPDVIETWKWMGTPVWEIDGIICTGEAYKDKIKLTFVKGASLADPGVLFNASLDGNARRAIDIHQGETVDSDAFKALIRAAVDLNASTASAKAKPKRTK